MRLYPICFFGYALACQATVPSLPPEVAQNLCRVNAVTSVLPENPDLISVGDLRVVVERLRACRVP